MAIVLPLVPAVSQFDDPTSNQDDSNCTAACGARMVRYAIGVSVSPGDFRDCQDDQSGGIDLGDLETAAQRCWGVNVNRDTITAARLDELLAASYMVAIQGDYDQVPSYLSLQPGFRQGHCITADAVRSSPQTGKQYYIVDPLGRPSRGYKGRWWPASVVYAYARKLSSSTSLRCAWVRKIPSVAQPRVSVREGEFFSYRVVAGRYVISRTRRKTGGFSGTCTAPRWLRGLGSRREYVLITDPHSAYRGTWLALGTTGVTIKER